MMSRCCRGSTASFDDQVAIEYDLAPLATSDNPSTMPALCEWLKARAGGKGWFGKAYVAESIHLAQPRETLVQTGCSPNYLGRLWTLACCKHAMRGASPFRSAFRTETPVFIFTLASKKGCDFQGLVNVARITRAFESMGEYAEWIRDHQNREVQLSRFTRTDPSKRHLGWRFGDCHADTRGDVGAPTTEHVHAAVTQWQPDRNGKHLILASNDFILYGTPRFRSKETMGPSRYGFNWGCPRDVKDGLAEI